MSGGSVSRAVFGVAGVLLLSRVLGFLREVVIAHRFGTSAQYDLYLVAIMFSALAYGIFNYAGYYLFVPYLTRKLQAAQGSTAPDFWPLVNSGAVAAIIMAAVLVLAAPLLLRFWTVDYLAADYAQVVFYSRITAVAVVLGVGEAFMRAFLNVKRIYSYPAFGYIVFNLFSIGSIFFFADSLGVSAIALGWIGGLLVQNIYLGLRLAGVHSFGGYRPQVFTDETKFLVTTAGALIVIELINRSYFLIDRYFAPQFGEGIVSALNYSQVLVQLPDSIVGFAIGAVVFPIFSAHSGEGDRKKFWGLYSRSITVAFLLAVPIAGALFVSAPEVVYLLFQRGEFDPTSTAITVTVLRPYLPALIALFLVSMSIRACYSGGWVRAVFYAAVGVFAVKAIGTAVLSRWVGYAGISAGTSLAEVGFALVLVATVVRRVRPEGGRAFVWTLVRILIAGVAASALAIVVLQWLPEGMRDLSRLAAVGRIAIAGITLLAGYAMIGFMLGLRDQFGSLWMRRTAQGSGV